MAELELMDEHVGEHGDELQEEPMAKILGKLHNEMFRLWEIMISATSAGHIKAKNGTFWQRNPRE